MFGNINSVESQHEEDTRFALINCLDSGKATKADVVDKVLARCDPETVLKNHVRERMADYEHRNNDSKFQFENEKTARAELMKMLSGEFFELIVREEFAPQFFKDTKLLEISDALIDVCRNPRAYGLSHEKVAWRRIPDAVFARFKNGTLEVEEIVEATNGGIDSRKISQLGNGHEGSRETMRVVVNALNAKLQESNRSEKLNHLADLLAGMPVGLSEDVVVILVVSNKEAKYDTGLSPKERHVAVKKLISRDSDTNTRGELERKFTELLQPRGEGQKASVDIQYSRFESDEVAAMASVFLETIFQEYKTTLVKENIPGLIEEGEQNEAQLREDMSGVLEFLGLEGWYSADTVPDRLQAYADWLVKQLRSRHVDGGKEIQKNEDRSTRRHILTGFTRNGDNRQFEERLNRHVNMWRVLFNAKEDEPLQNISAPVVIGKLADLVKE